MPQDCYAPRSMKALPTARKQRPLTLRCLLLTFLPGMLLLSQLSGNASFLATPAYASSTNFSAGKPANLTFQQFLKMRRNDGFYHGPPVRPASYPKPHNPSAINTAKMLPSAEPATMKPISQALDAAFLTASAGAKAIDVLGSDGRLEVQLARGSLDLSHATVAGGVSPTGTLTLQISEMSGHFIGASNLLGTYQVQVVDSKGWPVSGIQLHTPVTFTYHYQPLEMDGLNLDPGHLLLTWPSLIAAARQAKRPITGLILPLQNDPKAHTLSAQSKTLGPGPFSMGGDGTNQTPPIPGAGSVQGNSGQLAYSYPLSVSPGVGGFVPQLALTYSSSGPNGRSNRTSPAENVGEGWSLSLGAISSDVYPGGSASAKTWYFISGVDNISDRLVPDTSLPTKFNTTGTFYDTQHLSNLLIQQVTSSQTSQICFHVWDKAGTYYEFGCTTDSLQYSTDSGGTRHNYQWDMNKIVAPNEGQQASYFKVIEVTYKRDSTTDSHGYVTIRDSGIQQIVYGDDKGSTDPPVTDVAGTIDFTYLAPPYSQNCNCAWSPPATTTLRCDDPLNFPGGLNAPNVMSTMTLQSITSYVGADTAGKPAYGYNLAYTDNPFHGSADSTQGTNEYIAGEHLLTSITPLIYQQGTAHSLPSIQFSYSPSYNTVGSLQNTFYDPSHYPFGATSGAISTIWQYLTSYIDTNSGIGENIQYGTAYNNTNGTPNRTDGNGKIIDDRHDPLYCFNYLTDCPSSGNYSHPDQLAWTMQIVTQIQASGKDSNALTSFATTRYSYTLAITGEYTSGTNCYPYPSPSNYQPGQNDCVGDNWMPSGDTDWGDYYHAEFRGFASVAITNPSGDLKVGNYASTEGWFTPDTDFANYGAGSLLSEYVYQGGQAISTALLHDTTNYYAGGLLINHTPPVDGATACVSASATDAVYTPCEVMVLNILTAEVNRASGTQPTVENDFTYDDYNVMGWVSGGYHQLQQEVTTSSNAPTFTRKWTYYTNVSVGGSWTYYNVNSVKHSEVDDNGAPTHIWQCQNITYDEGAPTGTPTPAAGWPTAVQTYSNSNCASAGPANTIATNYTGYDAFGNPVATVDGVAQTNSSDYSSNGCALSRPYIFTSASNWAMNLNYTTCTFYGSHNAQPTQITYALAPPSSPNLSISFAYDDSQGSMPVTSTDMNGQQTTTSYTYTSGNRTVQALMPPDTSGYTTQTSTNTACTSTSTLPCFEIDSNTSLYSNALSSTFYDALGRVVETSTPGPAPANPIAGDAYYTVVLTEYKDDSTDSVWQSNPFVVAVPSTQRGAGWLDPSNAKDYTGTAPGGSVTFYDALGRPIAFDDPVFVAGGSVGVSCPSLGSNAASCTLYGLGQVSGDSNTYALVTSIDPNDHVSTSYIDMLGRIVYVQAYSGTYGSTTLTGQKAIQYNVLNEPTQVKVTDEAQTGMPSVTTTASYDDLGRLTTLNDPDRGTHNYTYDADNRLIKDVSSSVTIGYSYDLMGRIGCVQDQAPPSPVSPTGACSSGANPFTQYTYDVSAPGANWSGSDYPKGRLTQTYAINYFPGPDNTQGKVTEQVQYDQRGRAVNQNLLITATGGTLTFPTFPTYKLNLLYNDANQVTSAQTSSNPSGLGYIATPVYDSATGVETGLSSTTTATANVSSITYNAQALISSINFLASSTTTVASESFQYDGDLRPNSANACWQTTCTVPPNCPTAAFFCQGLTYDAASNIINLSTTQAAIPGITNSGGSEVQVFCYDEQNRLTWAGNSGTPPASCSGNGAPSNTLNGAGYHTPYSYSNLGQITQGPYNGSGASQQYLYCDSNHPHALTAVDAMGSTCTSQTGTNYTASYDARGNMTSRAVMSGSSLDTQTLSFDGLDHLVRWNDTVTTSNEEWYMYDASGSRVLQRSTTGSGVSNTTITVYAFGLEEHAYSGSGTLNSSKYYYSLAGHLLGKTSGSGALTFYLTDMLGSVLASFSGASGTSAVSGNQTYGPYGKLQYGKGSMGTARGFTGQYKDDLSGLYNFGARYYDHTVGVFLSADTVAGNIKGENPYSYVNGNPENFNDPTGQRPIPVCGTSCGSDTSGGSTLCIVCQIATASTGNSSVGPACIIGCRSNVFVDTGSSWVPVTSPFTSPGCLGGVSFAGVGLPGFSIGGCFSGSTGGTSFVRQNNPPPTINYCPPPTGCGDDGENNNEDPANTKSSNGELAFAGEAEDGGLQSRPKADSTETTQAAAGEPAKTLYRVLRPDEDPSTGISAKDPNAAVPLDQHISQGNNPGFRSQYISTTIDLGVAMKWALPDDLRIAQIDPALVEGSIIDVSSREALANQGITWQNKRFAYSFALGSREVLIEGFIPPEAITWVGPVSSLAGLL